MTTSMMMTAPSSISSAPSMKRSRRRMIRFMSVMLMGFAGCLYLSDNRTNTFFPLKLRSKLRQTSSFHNQNNRQLRFFDPDHMLCGDTPKSHRFAVHCLYGGQKKIEPEYFWLNTVTTRQEFPIDDLDQVEHIVRVLAYVAQKLNRAIFVKIPVKLGYLKELVQPYSIVNGGELDQINVPIVDPGYWSRAGGIRMKNIERKNMTISSVEDLQTIVQYNHTEEELVFDLDEIVQHIDLDDLGELMGVEGGYDNGEWQHNFTCREPHPEPPPVPHLNDQDNWGIVLYDNVRQEAVL